jgi:hypothetical protein
MTARPAGRLLVSTVAATVAWLAVRAIAPPLVAGHALGGVFTLPVPLYLYLAGAAAAVAASFVVAVVVVRAGGTVAHYPTRPILPETARRGSLLLRGLGMAWWFGAIAIGLVINEVSPAPAVLFWILIWVGLPIVTVLFGNPWPSLSPFRTLFGLLERAARWAGFDRLDLGLRYPAVLGRWPAVLLLFVTVWCELILPDRIAPRTVALLMGSYTVVTLIGVFLFGRVGWLRNAELFEVYLGWFGRVGPIGRRVVEPEACAGCAEECDPDHCVDCPECTAVAGGGEQRPEMRPWFTGLSEVTHAAWSDGGFIVLVLAAVTFDGLSETSVWAAVMKPLSSSLSGLLGPTGSVLVAQTLGLLVLWLAFLGAFSLATRLTRAMHDAGKEPRPLGATVGAYAPTLLPIAGGYLIAHYLTLLVQGIAWLPGLIVDPVTSVAPPLDWMPISAVWYLSVGAIVLGHIAAVVLAHRLALREAARRPILAGLPLVVLMIGYTVLSLWIIAQPIAMEPGS